MTYLDITHSFFPLSIGSGPNPINCAVLYILHTVLVWENDVLREQSYCIFTAIYSNFYFNEPEILFQRVTTIFTSRKLHLHNISWTIHNQTLQKKIATKHLNKLNYLSCVSKFLSDSKFRMIISFNSECMKPHILKGTVSR